MPSFSYSKNVICWNEDFQRIRQMNAFLWYHKIDFFSSFLLKLIPKDGENCYHKHFGGMPVQFSTAS